MMTKLTEHKTFSQDFMIEHATVLKTKSWRRYLLIQSLSSPSDKMNEIICRHSLSTVREDRNISTVPPDSTLSMYTNDS
jgi:hypothetical protein